MSVTRLPKSTQHRTFVILPAVVEFVEVGVVEWSFNLGGTVVVHLAVAVELIKIPLAVVG